MGFIIVITLEKTMQYKCSIKITITK